MILRNIRLGGGGGGGWEFHWEIAKAPKTVVTFQ